MKPNAIDRFMSHVDTSEGPDACHPWTACSNWRGYGWFRVEGQTWLAPRWLLGHLRGSPLRPGEVACHHCDNPPCCNPRHLYVGTQADNSRDCWSRGRGRSLAAEANAAKVNCIRNHRLTSGNTYITPDGRRQCRECIRIRARRRRKKRGASVRSPP